jgi:hypothetical protein
MSAVLADYESRCGQSHNGGNVRNSALLLAASLLAIAAPAHATNDQVQRGPVPRWVSPSEPLPVPADASGLVFVRYQDIVSYFDRAGMATYQASRVKILHPNALQMGNVSIGWNPASGAPTVHFVRVYRDGVMIDALRDSSFEILRREGQLEAARLDGMLTAILRVPDLRVGDELEIGLTSRVNDPTLGSTVSGNLFLTAQVPAGRFRLGLNWENGEEPRLQMTPDMRAVAQSSDRAIDFRFDNPPTMAPPNDAPARYNWQRVVEYSDFADWAAVSARFAPLFARASRLAPNSPLRAEAARIAAAHANPMDRAKAALRLVQQEVRYIYVGLNAGNLTPATADETWQQRYGDCKGKTAMLLALLSELGIGAEAVLVNNSNGDDGLDQRLPTASLFDHVLVRARIGDATYWLDGTLPVVAEPARTPVMPYRWVLPLNDQGRSLERVEWRVPDRPDELNLFEIDARAGFDQPAQITNTIITRGVAGMVQYLQLSPLTPAQMLAAVRQQMTGDTWQSIDSVSYRYDMPTQASVIVISGSGTADWESEAGQRRMSLPGGGVSPPQRRIRPAEQDQAAPYAIDTAFACNVATVRIPQTTRAGQWSNNDGYTTRMFGRTYFRAFDIRDGAIRMVRSSRAEQPEISAADAGRDNARIAAFDNSMAWITYNPVRIRPAASSATTVPATYDMDWTADDRPCRGATPAE